MKQYHIVDLFAGVGGLSYGFSQLPGFRILAANEIEKDIAAAYSLNHPGVKMLNCDIADLTKERLAGALGGQQVDIVVGGPPCQSYSTLGKRRMDDRANLFLQYKRILQILQPQAFIFENVTGILSMDHGRLFQRVESEFRALGYDVRHDILNAVDFGVPQQRERVILVGMKGENNYIFPVPTHGPGKKPYVTLKDAIGDLPQLKSGESASHYAGVAENEFLRFVRAGAGQLVTEHAAPKNGAHLIRIMQTLQDGQSKDDLPEEIRPKSGYGNTYAKLWWERPSTTITRNFACPSSSRCIHPRDSRAMSIREGARLQSFPDDYRFYGSDGMKRLEIGNAVPPLLSVAIVQEMQSALKRKEQMQERSDPMRLTDQQIEETYRLIEQHHQEFLVSQGVRLPRLRQAGQYTKYALTLVYLAQGYPHTRTVSKKELTEFIRQYYPDVNDVQQAIFDLYDGGGIDVACLGGAEFDREGNVNVSRFGEKIPGPGGFINISQGAKKACFMGSFTAGESEIRLEGGRLRIIKDGNIRKFRQAVGHITFSGEYSNQKGTQQVLYITERAVFRLTPEGLLLCEIAPGADLRRDILEKMEFTPLIAPDLREMDAALFTE